MRVIFQTLAIILSSQTLMAQMPDNSLEADSPDTTSISVSEFGRGNVIGLLGHSLGKVVRVTGTAIDGDSTRMKRDAGKTLLSIETVNDKKLPNPVVFTFLRAKKGIEKPEPGAKFDYYVHEFGYFDGVVEPPKELNIETPSVANDGFYYRPQIIIHKSMSAPAPVPADPDGGRTPAK